MRALALTAALGLAAASVPLSNPEPVMEFQSLSPVIFVDAVEPCIPFWTERLGFRNIGEVPHGDALGFVMLQRDNVTVMYQSYASAEADIPGIATRGRGAMLLYVRLAGFEDILRAVDGAEIVVPERTTFYGAREIGVRAPCGTVVLLAEMTE